MEYVKSYEDIVKEYQERYQKAYPSFRRIPSGTVIDEEKSVRWNREEVERRNAQGKAEVEKAYKLMSKLTEEFYTNVSEALHSSFRCIPFGVIKDIVIKTYERSDRDAEKFNDDVWYVLEMAEKAVIAVKGNN